MSEHQQVFEVSELPILSHKCAHCGNLVTFDVLTNEKYGLPKTCAVCNQPFGAAATAFQAFREFYRAATLEGLSMRLHTKPTVQRV